MSDVNHPPLSGVHIYRQCAIVIVTNLSTTTDTSDISTTIYPRKTIRGFHFYLFPSFFTIYLSNDKTRGCVSFISANVAAPRPAISYMVQDGFRLIYLDVHILDNLGKCA